MKSLFYLFEGICEWHNDVFIFLAILYLYHITLLFLFYFKKLLCATSLLKLNFTIIKHMFIILFSYEQNNIAFLFKGFTVATNFLQIKQI